MKQKTAVLYARYSSPKQREVSIDDQLKACQDYCEREGIEVVNVYHDNAMSGTNDNRPDFQRMVANAGESDYVIVYMMERFSRDKYDAPIYKKKLAKKGVKVLSAMEYIPDTPEGVFLEKLLEGQAAYYSLDLSRKIKRGMKSNAEKCLSNGYHKFGYDIDKTTGRYVINPAEADVVKDIYTRYINGETAEHIGSTLAKQGYTTSRGNPFNDKMVRRILHNEAYKGIYQWGDTRIVDGMPAIVDDITFRSAQNASGRRTRAMDNIEIYPLTGKLYCALCGNPMHGVSAYGKRGDKYCYYRCKDKGGCGRKPIPKDTIETALMKAILKVANNENTARRIAEKVVESYQGEGKVKTAIEVCERRIKENKDAMHNIEKAIEKGFINDDLKKRFDKLNEQRSDLTSELGRLKVEDLDMTVDDITEFLLHGFDAADAELLLGGYLNRAFLFDGYIVATLNFRNEVNELEEIEIAMDEFGFDCGTNGCQAEIYPENKNKALTCEKTNPERKGFVSNSNGGA